MPKFLISLPQMPRDSVKKAGAKAREASVGSGCTMEMAYVKKFRQQAICCWDAPDRDVILSVFEKAGIVTESVEEVDIYRGLKSLGAYVGRIVQWHGRILLCRFLMFDTSSSKLRYLHGDI